MFLNQVTLIGNLTRDPEHKALPSGTNVCSFSIATNKVYFDKDKKKQEKVEYHNIICFGSTADNVAKFMTKGCSILILGELQTRSWDKDGVKMYRTEVLAERVQFGPKPGGATAQAKPAQQSSSMPDFPEEEINPEDIPF